MTSKAERNRKRKIASRQRRGRPLKGNAVRYPSGKVKAERIGPTEELLAQRCSMLGYPAGTKLSPAEMKATVSPADFALHSGWITANEHRAGELFVDLYRRSGFGLPPAIKTHDYELGPKGNGAGSLGNPEAMKELRRVFAALRSWPRSQVQVVAVYVLGERPGWMDGRSGHQAGAVQLATGLRIIGRVLGTGTEVDERAA